MCWNSEENPRYYMEGSSSDDERSKISEISDGI
jgi:hypothetical protein